MNDTLREGQLALAAGRWTEARDAFAAALAAEETPEAHDGLGRALWWLNDIAGAHQHRQAAYVGFRVRGEHQRAGVLAAWLAREFVFYQGNSSAMAGWFARADRLLAGESVERAWFLIYRASLNAPPADLERVADQAIAIAGLAGDTDLEAFALAFRGLARVSIGKIRAGMADLDEAMATATSGEVIDRAVACEILCVLLSACALVGDLDRTEQWCAVARSQAERDACVYLSAYCRTTYGSHLATIGRWQDAEHQLTEAIDQFESGHRGLRVPAVIQLADLRVQQGRLVEAEALLAGLEDQGAATIPLARLALAQGDIPRARHLLQRLLDGDPEVGQAGSLDLLAEICLSGGDLAAGAQAADRLAAIAALTDSPLLEAQAALARAKVARAAGNGDGDVHLASAIALLPEVEQSMFAGAVRLEMARLLELRDVVGAVTWARAALATFDRLGAQRDADACRQLLRRLGAPSRPGRPNGDLLTDREREVLALIAAGLTNRAIADRLFISPKTAEHHVSQILSKLGAQSRAEAAGLAARLTD